MITIHTSGFRDKPSIIKVPREQIQANHQLDIGDQVLVKLKEFSIDQALEADIAGITYTAEFCYLALCYVRGYISNAHSS